MKIKKPLIFLATALILIGGAIFYFQYGLPWDLFSTKNRYQTYLEEKYGKTFIIDEISYDIFHDRYHAKAYPLDEPEITFTIGTGASKNEIIDSYPLETWNHQIQHEWGPIVKRIYPDLSSYSMEVVDFNNSLADSPSIPNYRDRAIVGISIALDKIMITTKNRQKELLRAFELITFVKETRVTLGYFQLTFKNKILQVPPEEIKTATDVKELETLLGDYK